MDNTNIHVELYSAVIMITMLISYLISAKKSEKYSITFIGIMILHTIILLTDACTYRRVGNNRTSYSLAFILVYILTGLLTVLFNKYFLDSLCKRIHINAMLKIIPWFVWIISSVLWISSYYNGIFYTITDDGYEYGRWHIFSQLILASVILFDMLFAIYNCAKFKKRELVAWELYGIIPLVGVGLESVINSAMYVYTGITIVIIIVYLNIGVEIEKQLIQREEELTKAHTKLMISQIKPHFLFNALSTIKSLCDQPEIAQAAIAQK